MHNVYIQPRQLRMGRRLCIRRGIWGSDKSLYVIREPLIVVLISCYLLTSLLRFAAGLCDEECLIRAPVAAGVSEYYNILDNFSFRDCCPPNFQSHFGSCCNILISRCSAPINSCIEPQILDLLSTILVTVLCLEKYFLLKPIWNGISNHDCKVKICYY